jgi:hypothetical protein
MGRSRRKSAKRKGHLGPLLIAAFLILLLFSLGVRYRTSLVDGGRWLQTRLQTDRSADSRQDQSSTDGAVGSTGEEVGSSPLSLQILNATGVRDLALETGQRLRAWDIDVIDRGNAPSWPFPETMLIVRRGGGDRVEDLSGRLGEVPIIIQRRDDLVLDATLILGHDWQKYRWPEDSP